MSSQPKVTPRRSKGSIVSQTYEFPYMRQARQRTLAQLIYDGRQGKILGRTPKNWGKQASRLNRRINIKPSVVCAPNQHR